MKILPNTIINFHAIHDEAWMDSVFALLKRHYTIVAISDIERFYYKGLQLKNSCHITFDDGDSSFYFTAFPLLKKHNIAASIYVSPHAARERSNFWFQEIRDYDKVRLMRIIADNNLLGQARTPARSLNAALKSMTIDAIWTVIRHYQKGTGTPPKACMNMTENQLREVKDSGLVTVGAHTLNHPILRNESDEKAAHEIQASIRDLGALLNTEIKYFAYPNGLPDLDFGEREMNILRQSGITLSFSTENKSFSRRCNPLSISRNGLTYGKQHFIIMKLLAGSNWEFLKRIIKGKQENDYRIAALRTTR